MTRFLCPLDPFSRSVCGHERLPVHVGKFDLGKSLLSGPWVPLARPFNSYSGGWQQCQHLRWRNSEVMGEG